MSKNTRPLPNELIARDKPQKEGYNTPLLVIRGGINATTAYWSKH